MRILIYGDANVDVTVGWGRAERNLGKLPKKSRDILSHNITRSKELGTDLEHYLPTRDERLSRFFSSLNPKVKLGGCGAIKARTMALLGHDIVFHSWVGDDRNGGMILKELSKAGVDVSHMKVVGKTCETYNLFDRKKPRLAFSFWENKLDFSKFAKAAKKENPDMVFLTGVHRLKRGIGYAKLPGAYVFTGSFATYTKKQIEAKYAADSSTGVLVGNDLEMMQLSGIQEPLSAVAALPNSVIVMHGRDEAAVKRGCSIMVTDTGQVNQSKVVEKTGLGDVWESVFLSETGNIETASEKRILSSMQLATKAAKKRMLTGRFP